MNESIPISEHRLRRDVERTADFGEIPTDDGRGRTAITGTAANERGREYFVEQLENAGLEVRVDAVGNVVGRWTPESAEPSASPVASGSHLDSVPRGGIFDGVLGVYGALEAVRALQEADVELRRPVEVVCFTEEEGHRFSDGVLGSSVAVGKREVADALALTDDEGTTLKEALSGIGFRGDGRLDATEWDAWMELHVEQGTNLEDADVPVGVVTDITGTTHCHVTIRGAADHAGTTPMSERNDALVAASELVLTVKSATEDVVEATSETAVGTVGELDLEPNAINVVPGQVELGIDVRDVDAEAMETVVSAVKDDLSRLESDYAVTTTFERPYDLDPVAMTDYCLEVLRDAALERGVRTMDLHSGAGHDTMHVARVTDAGLVFAPSRDGASHSPREWTDWSDAARATLVLADAIARLARR